MILFSSLILSLLITIALVPVAAWFFVRLHALDVPDERKIHDHPIPRSGGIAMAVGVLLPLIFLLPKDMFLVSYLLGTGVIVFFGMIDDFRDLGYKSKFAAQIAAALIVVLAGGVRVTKLGFLLPDGWLLPVWIAIPFTVLIIVAVTNAINLADGLDGLAGGITLLCFYCIGYLAYAEGQMTIMTITVCLAGAIFGFLRFNTYPATVFMGDTGSQFLGYSAIVLSLVLTQENTPLSPLLPLLLLGFPILDTLVVMVQRRTEKRPLFSPDKNHFHHRLLSLGLYHTEAVLVIYLIQIFLVVVTILLKYQSEWILLGCYILFSGVVVAAFTLTARTGWKLQHRQLIDRVLKSRLRIFRGHRYAIRTSFRIFQYGLYALLIVTCFIPVTIPVYLSIAAGIAIVILLAAWFLRSTRMLYVLMGVLYLFTPLLVYLSTVEEALWMNATFERFYNLSFLVLAFFAIVTLKFTDRKQGFKIKPTDLLIFSIAVGVPFLFSGFIKDNHIPYIATRIVLIFFGYEVLGGELRGKYGKLTIFTITALAVLAVRGIVG